MCTLNIKISWGSVLINTAQLCMNELIDLNRVAKENDVTLELWSDKLTVIGKRCRTYKVSKKYVGDPVAMCGMLRDRINKAWPE